MNINRYGYTIDSINPQPTLLTHTEIILYDINKQHTIFLLTLFFKWVYVLVTFLSRRIFFQSIVYSYFWDTVRDNCRVF